MQQFRIWWNSFKTVAIVMSFITNFVLLVVVLLLMMQIFQIKNGILEPLIDGLHSNFVGMDQAVIERTIEVEDEIPVVFDLPLNQQTNVVLTEDVPIAANATFTLPGGGGVINGRVDIILPQNLILPVQLDMIVPVDTDLPISLPVGVSIPLRETELHTPFVNLRDLLEPYVRVIDNLPSNWGDVPDFIIEALQGDVYLLEQTEDSRNPWQEPYEPLPEGSTGLSEQPGETVLPGTTPQPGMPTGPTIPGFDGTATPGFGGTATPVQDIGIISPTAQPGN